MKPRTIGTVRERFLYKRLYLFHILPTKSKKECV